MPSRVQIVPMQAAGAAIDPDDGLDSSDPGKYRSPAVLALRARKASNAFPAQHKLQIRRLSMQHLPVIRNAVRRLQGLALQSLLGLTVLSTTPGFAAPGDLDTSLNSTGKVFTAIGSGDDTARAVALQPDGKIVAVGHCFNGNDDDFCLVRYLSTGALDTSFGSAGKVTTAIGDGGDYATAVALQPDGKIVAAGYCSNGTNDDFCLARYLNNGTVDVSFNGTGKVLTAIGSGTDAARALALQPDGKIVVAGFCESGVRFVFCLARFQSSGPLDASFNGTGTVTTVIGSNFSFAFALALQPDGKIIAAGTCNNGSNNDFCLARYLVDGALDLSFNGTGWLLSPIGNGHDDAFAAAVSPDGKIVLAGSCSNGMNNDFCLGRYLSNGAFDTSFNGTGKVFTPIDNSNDLAIGIVLQPDGKIVTAGFCSNGNDNDFCVARYLSHGALDPSFNGTGKALTAMGSGTDFARALALQPDGKIVVAGYCFGGSNYDFCLARYQGGPFEARNCTMDIDGDNQVLATTDSLIHTRIALGISGSAVLSGITFAPHASRTTWPAIRDYLVSQCGMSIVP